MGGRGEGEKAGGEGWRGERLVREGGRGEWLGREGVEGERLGRRGRVEGESMEGVSMEREGEAKQSDSKASMAILGTYGDARPMSPSLCSQAQLEHSTHALLVGLLTHLSASQEGAQQLLKLQGIHTRLPQRVSHSSGSGGQGQGQEGGQQGQGQQGHLDFLGASMKLLGEWTSAARGRDAAAYRHQGVLQVRLLLSNRVCVLVSHKLCVFV